MIITPFIKDGDEDIEEQYIKADYFYEDTKNRIPKPCVGLASAYLYETLSISFSSSTYWHKTEISINIKEKDSSKIEIVYNVFSDACFNNEAILKQIEDYGNVVLEKTKINVADKKIDIKKHHGIKESKKLCNKLKLSPYVEEMRSTHWGGTKFIRKITKKGSIEIVLYKTEEPYALLIKTTGRNETETEKIAEILKKNLINNEYRYIRKRINNHHRKALGRCVWLSPQLW